ncbi:Transposable element Hobo transposase [Amphibalanus amphitrite]|uniref:Transposable element Hobo transposase n=1 Tax=Amphibalanus amphitrite TaxID=1232801 RepID=A0A6A4WDP4_AMPAM|nr:Transposable element Hobo transposase [Amphibalanus amphitrite]
MERTKIAVCKSLVSLVKRKGLNHLLEKSLKQQVETRWNSLLTMIRSVLEALPELQSQRFAQSEVSDLVVQLSRSQMHALIDLLHPFEMASEQLSTARYSTLHSTDRIIDFPRLGVRDFGADGVGLNYHTIRTAVEETAMAAAPQPSSGTDQSPALKERRPMAIEDLKSYFIKTAALWMAQETPGG